MTALHQRPISMSPRIRRAIDASRLAARLREECRGDVLFDVGSRGRYSTDASIYQIFPIGVVLPCDENDARAAMAVAHSILVIIYHLLRDGVAYEEKGEAFFEEQDREFIERRLVRQLEQLGHQVTLQPLAQAG